MFTARQPRWRVARASRARCTPLRPSVRPRPPPARRTQPPAAAAAARSGAESSPIFNASVQKLVLQGHKTSTLSALCPGNSCPAVLAAVTCAERGQLLMASSALARPLWCPTTVPVRRLTKCLIPSHELWGRMPEPGSGSVVPPNRSVANPPLVEDIGFQIGVVGYHIRIEIKKLENVVKDMKKGM